MTIIELLDSPQFRAEANEMQQRLRDLGNRGTIRPVIDYDIQGKIANVRWEITTIKTVYSKAHRPEMEQKSGPGASFVCSSAVMP